MIVMCFFFSSRRRHTRYWRDWSSDVCSSDLGAVAFLAVLERQVHEQLPGMVKGMVPKLRQQRRPLSGSDSRSVLPVNGPRSEERRVGKECRSRWSPYH